MAQPVVNRVLFDRYTSGLTSADETEAVQQWLAQPANQVVAQHWMQQHWHTLNEPAVAQARRLGEPDYEAMLLTLHQQMGLPQQQPLMRVLPVPLWRRWAAAAAVVGVLAGAGSWWVRSSQPAPTATAAATTTYQTAFGSTRLVRLPDGSRVTLNANSTLRYTASTNGAPRQAWLEGEGFFEVSHTPDHQRFVVRTADGLRVEVLGTRFSVYRRRQQARVVLVSGKVQVSFADARLTPFVMKPGDVVEVGARRAPAAAPELVRRAVAHPETYAGWKDGKLVLDETPISELTARLQDTYGLRVEVKNPALNRRRITGTVPIGDLEVLLLALQESFNLRVERQPGLIILSDR